MQNSTFFYCFFEGDFCSKNKNSLPPNGFGSRSCKGLAVVWTRIVEFFGSGVRPKSVKTFFWRSPDFGRKNPLNFSEDLFFFGDHLNLTEKPPQSHLRLMQVWVKFVYGCIKLQKKPPPHPAESWLRAW